MSYKHQSIHRRPHGRHSPLSGQNGFTTTPSPRDFVQGDKYVQLQSAKFKSKSAGKLLAKLFLPYKGPRRELYLATLTITSYLKYRFDGKDYGSSTIIMRQRKVDKRQRPGLQRRIKVKGQILEDFVEQTDASNYPLLAFLLSGIINLCIVKPY